ncbi:MAG: efflux RND transporter periplasmic adaptor subunit [Myxococcota bacterium]
MLPLLPWWIAACSAPAETGPKGPPPAVVAVAPVRAGTLADTWSYLGDVRALERAELAAGASGAVTSVAVREGDAIAVDQVLLEVDLALAAAEWNAARADAARIEEQLAQAGRTRDRLKRVESGVLAESELEAAESNVKALAASVDSAHAAVRVAGAKLERHRVRAPFAGVVARRYVDPGDWVDPGKVVLDVVSTGTVEVQVEAPLQLAGRIRAGDEAELRGIDTVSASVVGVVPALDPVSRTAAIRLSPAEVPGWLVPGTPVQVAFRVQHDGGLVVPRDAVVKAANEARVFAVSDGVARSVAVTELASSAEEVLVQAESLAAGDEVVVRGNERLRPDQPVQVAE